MKCSPANSRLAQLLQKESCRWWAAYLAQDASLFYPDLDPPGDHGGVHLEPFPEPVRVLSEGVGDTVTVQQT